MNDNTIKEMEIVDLLKSIRHIISNMKADYNKLKLAKETRWKSSSRSRGAYFLNKQKSLLQYAQDLYNKGNKTISSSYNKMAVDDLKSEMNVLTEMYFRTKKKYIQYIDVHQMPNSVGIVA